MKIQNILLSEVIGLIFNSMTLEGVSTEIRICLLNDVLPSEKEALLNNMQVSMLDNNNEEIGMLKYVHTQELKEGGIETFDLVLGNLAVLDDNIIVSKNSVKLDFFTFENVVGIVGGWCIYNQVTNKIIGLDFIDKNARYVNNNDITISTLSLISISQ